MIKQFITICLLVSLILSSIISTKVNADDITLNPVDTSSLTANSCIQRNLVAAQWGFADSLLTFGLVDYVKNKFKMIDIGSLKSGANGIAESEIVRQVYYTSSGRKVQTDTLVRRCDMQTNDIKFCFNASLFSNDCKSNIYSFTEGQEAKIGEYSFRSIRIADQLCVQTYFLTTGWITLGCKTAIPQQLITIDSSIKANNDIIDASCFDVSNALSKGIFPITSSTIQCVKSSIHKVFFSSDNSMIATFRTYMLGFINAALVLFVLFVGMKITLGAEQYRKHEFYMNMFKFMLVVYFTSLDGIQWLYNSFMGFADGLSLVVYQAGSNIGLCDYSKATYPVGFEFLRLWDAIDCRLLYYTGLMQADTAWINSLINSIQNGSYLPLCWDILKCLFTLIINFDLVTLLIIIIIAVLLISIIAHVLHTYVIAYFAITLTIYIAPLFVPMALFQQTKSYFDGWLKSLIGYTLQPMILILFVSLMLISLDQAMFNKCSFSTQNVSIGSRENIPIFSLTNLNSDDGATCKKTLGYKLSTLNNASFNVANILSVFKYTKMIIEFDWKEMMTVLGLIILFYFVVPMVGGFATDLTGAANLSGIAVGPQAFANFVASKAWQGAKFVANSIAPGSGKVMDKVAKESKKALDESTSFSNRSTPGGGGDNESTNDFSDRSNNSNNSGNNNSNSNPPPAGGSNVDGDRT